MFKHIASVVTILVLCLSFPACEKQADSSSRFADTSPTLEDVKEKAEETARAAKSHALEKKREYERKIQVELKNFDSLISDLKKKAQGAEAQAKDVLNRAVGDLEEKRRLLRKSLEEFESASADASERLQTAVDAALRDMRKSYEEATSELK